MITVTLLCVGLAVVRSPLAMFCPLIYFYFLVKFFEWRCNFKLFSCLLLSASISIALSMILLTTAGGFGVSSNPKVEQHGILLPPSALRVIAVVIAIFFFGAMLSVWSFVWYCIAAYKQPPKVSSDVRRHP
jgi:hypothetical protein